MNALLVSVHVFSVFQGLELGDIGPGRKSARTRARDDNHANLIIGLCLVEDGVQPVVHGRVHRVQGVRPVQGDGGDWPMNLEEHDIGHAGTILLAKPRAV